MPFKINADDFKAEDKRLYREVMLDDIRKTAAEAFGTCKTIDEVGKHIKESLDQSQGGKWFCAVSFDLSKVA